MAISINWATRVITVPKADTVLVQSAPFEIRELDLDVFRLALKALEDDEVGMAFVRTHNHNPPVTFGGIALARVVEIINEYTVTFEDGNYAVNLAGANSNVADRLNLNSVSVRSQNSAGLVIVEAGSGVSNQDKLDIADEVRTELAAELAKIASLNFTVAGKVDANVHRVNDTPLTGDGSAGDPWGPA